MRKLKLQMQLSVDGFCGRLNGELDWMTWDWDDELKKFVDDLHKTVDTILLGRKMTDGFVSHWSSVKPGTEEYPFARLMVEYQKYVFSRTLTKSEWENTELVKENSVDFINELKKKPGKDIIVYGGADFVSSLVKDNLIDEYYFFVNPTVIGNGLSIFTHVKNNFKLNLSESKSFNCGIVLNKYEPKS